MMQYELIAAAVEPGEFVTRRELAARVGRLYNGAFRQSLALAVEKGLLHQVWCRVGRQSGWGYCTPATQPRMEGF